MRMSLLLAVIFFTSSCSSDDDSGKDCESCTLEGSKLEICENDGDTYTITYEGESETINKSELEGLDPEEFVDSICALGIFF
jgi:hypothetical protein